MLRIVCLIGVVWLLPAMAMAQEPPADTLVQTVASQLSAMAGTMQMLINARQQQQAEIRRQAERLDWFESYFKGLGTMPNRSEK